MDKLKIQIILGSTREGRQSEKAAKWLNSLLSKRTDIICELVDLRDYPLPFFNEPQSPSKMKVEDYSNEVAKAWYNKISEADAYIVVTPEYNHGYPGVLKNAFDYISKPWGKKPIAFVGCSNGLSSGIRVVEQIRQVVIDLDMVPIKQALYIPNVDKSFNENGNINDESQVSKATKMTDALVWWASLLKKGRGE